MTCAKVKVIAVLTTVKGERFVGENRCLSPQERCPRLPGEGYEKCGKICRQEAHAEVIAIANAMDAGARLTDAHITVFHTHICETCRKVLEVNGIKSTLVPPPGHANITV